MRTMAKFPDPSIRNFSTECQFKGHREETVNARRKVLNLLSEHVNKPLLEATESDIESWYRTFWSNPVWTRITYGRTVKAFYRWARLRQLRPDDPTVALPIPRPPRARPRPIPIEDLTEAIRATTDDRMRAWLALGAEAGLRAGEIARLNGMDIRPTEKAVDVINGKGGKDRTVPAGIHLLELLTPFRRAAGRGRLWQVTPQWVTRRVSAHFKELGMPWTCHNLRHSCATLLYQISNQDLLFVRDVLGHASVNTTAIYAGWSPAAGAKHVDELDSLLNRAS